MDKIKLTALLFSLLFNLPAHESVAAIAITKVELSGISQPSLPEAATATKKMTKKEQRLKKRAGRLKVKLAKRLDKIGEKPGRLISSNYLMLCLILFVAAVLFFAIGGAIFGIFGSVAALGSAVFFVLWLIEYTGTV
ncbi:MAG: hypothetical protein EPO28_05565 [Saprospiraceae bacterium]|nr:MAG: hypothetical protein EPO28_05565 [Saprospiraceae bacterium]